MGGYNKNSRMSQDQGVPSNLSAKTNTLLASDLTISSRSGYNEHTKQTPHAIEKELHQIPINGNGNLGKNYLPSERKSGRLSSNTSKSSIVDIETSTSSSTGLPPAKEVSNSQDIPLGS